MTLDYAPRQRVRAPRQLEQPAREAQIIPLKRPDEVKREIISAYVRATDDHDTRPITDLLSRPENTMHRKMVLDATSIEHPILPLKPTHGYDLPDAIRRIMPIDMKDFILTVREEAMHVNWPLAIQISLLDPIAAQMIAGKPAVLGLKVSVSTEVGPITITAADAIWHAHEHLRGGLTTFGFGRLEPNELPAGLTEYEMSIQTPGGL